MSDPNQPYVPQEYPKALYRDHGTVRIVVSSEEHEAASAEGFVDFSDLPERPADDYELLTHDQLVEVLVGFLRNMCQGRTRDELLELVRVQKDMAAHNAAVAQRNAEQEAIDQAVVALGGEAGEQPDHVLYGHSQLPDVIVIGGAEWEQGEVVGGAFGAFDGDEAAWNDLPTASRDALIDEWLKAAGYDPEGAVAGDDENESALVLATDGGEPTPAEPVAEASGDEHIRWTKAAALDALDHDADGKKGGEPELSEAVLKLRADLDALGVKYDKRWREARLTQALDEATKG